MPSWPIDAPGTLIRLSALPDVVVLTALAALLAIVPVALLWRLPPRWAAVVATLLVVPAVLPVPLAGVVGQAALLVAYVALPAAWGMRRVPRPAMRVAATLASPGRVFARIWLPLVLPWIAVGLCFALARALASAGLPWLAVPPLAAGAWPLARALAAR
jgi:ABC-type spermidine/putrescine transport system permease subunit II